MARFGFASASYTSESKNADCQICMNFYLESIESGMGKGAFAMYPTPGLVVFSALVGRSVRGELAINGRVFVVAGTTLYEVFSDGTNIARGTGLPDDLNMASLACSDLQLLVASGSNIYVLILATNIFQQVTANAIAGLGPLGPISQVAYADGYFMALLTGTARFQLSNLEDAANWNDLFVSQVSVFPENLVSMFVGFRELILFGGTHIVAYYDSGDTNNPWQPVQGGFIEHGCIAQFTPTKLDNSFFWLGGDERGAGIVWRANGYIPTRVSNHAVEFAINSYATISDAVGYAYQEKGHSFYVLYFPTANHTWVLDVATGLWHERGRWNGQQYVAWPTQCHAFAFGKHLVGDPTSGNLYQSSIGLLTDNGAEIRRLRRAPHISSEQEWIYHHRMQIDLEMGIGPVPSLSGPASGAASLTVSDPGKNPWNITIADNGTIQPTATPGAIPQPLILNDSAAKTSWQITATLLGQLVLTVVAYLAEYPEVIPFITSGSQLQSALSIVSGVLTADLPAAGTRDPQIMLRWSNDGAKTWGEEHWCSAGASGNYTARAIWNRLGRSRDRVYEMVVSDPYAWRVVDAYLTADPGFKPVERLPKSLSKMA